MNDDTPVNIGRLALESGETVTKRMRRMREPHRTALFEQVERRLKEVTDLLGPSASTEDRMVEIYLTGVHDGSQMQKISKSSALANNRLVLPQ